ncbi:MAG TPA: DNA mismatch repair protein MutS [Bacilli bacterium]
MAQYTPMIEQYLAVKAEVPDAILFFRLGDFYEMFFEDAIKGSQALEITLTGRGGGVEDKIPMCGVPYHAADNYISRLIEQGFKVAICDQVEDPADAKGIVRREIVRIITPGTVMDGKAAGEKSGNNFIVCLAEKGLCYGLTACDLATGEFYVTTIKNSLALLTDEVNVYIPSEIIGSPSLLTSLQQDAAQWSRPALCTAWQQDNDSLMKKQFASADLKDLSEASLQSISLLLSYLNVTQKRALSHLNKIRVYEQQQFMTLDLLTRKNLELTETVRDKAKKGSLLWLLDRSMTSMGSRMLRRWIEKPLMNKAAIEVRLEAVNMLYHQLITREEIRQQLKEVYDLERLVGRIAFGNANARDLIALKTSLLQVPQLVQICFASKSATLTQLVQNIDSCADILEHIDNAILDEPPVSVKDGGMIKPGYHEYLDQLREANINGKQWIAELEMKEREATGIKSLKIGFNRVFGYYIEVTKAHIGTLSADRYERRQTLANAERYITPELKEKETLILEAQEKMVDIEYELFSELRNVIASQMSRLQKLAEIIAVMDVYQSLATVSAANRYSLPQVTEGYDLMIEAGRHPVVEEVMKQGSYIANDSMISASDGRMLLITGPNMAGKSTYMRQVALICIMAQMGCLVPAKSAIVPLLDRVFTRIGAADDLISGQSTFMVEMMDIQVMTEKATKRSLVIIDELGRGTSTSEGMSIAQAVIEFLHSQIGCKTLVSTHFHELAHLEESLLHLRNYCMAVKESGEQVTFLRKLVKGAASTSYGIYCARIAGVPDSIIERAYTLLNEFEARVAIQNTQAETAAFVQLSMFEEQDKLSKKQQKKADPRTEQIIEQVKSVDLLNMTPLQAMSFIYELKKKITD